MATKLFYNYSTRLAFGDLYTFFLALSWSIAERSPRPRPSGRKGTNKTTRERSGNAHGHGTTSLRPGRARTMARSGLDATRNDAHKDITSGGGALHKAMIAATRWDNLAMVSTRTTTGPRPRVPHRLQAIKADTLGWVSGTKMAGNRLSNQKLRG